jgi:hypothetical protein
MNFAMSGWTRNSRNAPRNVAAANNGVTSTPPAGPASLRTGAASAVGFETDSTVNRLSSRGGYQIAKSN